MADIPCAGCAYPAACGSLCEYDRIDQEISRIVAEHHSPHQTAQDDREASQEVRGGALCGQPYQGDVTGLWWVAAIREPVAAQEQGTLW